MLSKMLAQKDHYYPLFCYGQKLAKEFGAQTFDVDQLIANMHLADLDKKVGHYCVTGYAHVLDLNRQWLH